jgi:hypothetical protein
MREIDQLWRQAAMTANRNQRARLEAKATVATIEARDLATMHQRALAAVKTLEAKP